MVITSHRVVLAETNGCGQGGTGPPNFDATGPAMHWSPPTFVSTADLDLLHKSSVHCVDQFQQRPIGRIALSLSLNDHALHVVSPPWHIHVMGAPTRCS